MTKKKTFVEPVLFKHKEKLDEITKSFNGLGSNCAETGPKGGRRGRRRRHRGSR